MVGIEEKCDDRPLTVTPRGHRTEASSRADGRTARTGQPRTFSSHTLTLQRSRSRKAPRPINIPLHSGEKHWHPTSYLLAFPSYLIHVATTKLPVLHLLSRTARIPKHERLTPIHPNQSSIPSPIPAHHTQHASQSSQTHASLPVPLKGSRWIASALKGPSQSPSARKASHAVPRISGVALSPFR